MIHAIETENADDHLPITLGGRIVRLDAWMVLISRQTTRMRGHLRDAG